MQSRLMPYSFKDDFGRKVAVIIDCFEIFIETPSNLLYIYHNTIKCFIAIALFGAIYFISEGFGGRVSELLTEECGFLDHLLPGNLVFTDTGFFVEDLLEIQCVTMNFQHKAARTYRNKAYCSTKLIFLFSVLHMG